MHYYVDEFCTKVKFMNYLLMILKVFEPFFGKLNCQLLLRPFQACTLFSYTSNMISTRIPISFTLNIIVRFMTIMILAMNPLLLFTISKLLNWILFIGPLISGYLLIKLAEKTGQNFQHDLQQAIKASIIPIFIYLYLFITSTSNLGKLSILLPIIQVILTDKGSLITSLMIGIVMVNESLLICYAIQYFLILKLLFQEKNQYTHFLVGILVPSSTEMIDNNILKIGYLLIYAGILLYQRYKVKKL